MQRRTLALTQVVPALLLVLTSGCARYNPIGRQKAVRSDAGVQDAWDGQDGSDGWDGSDPLDGGDGPDGDDSAFDGDQGQADCDVADPLPMDLEVDAMHLWECDRPQGCSWEGEAEVIFRAHPLPGWTSEAWLLFDGDDRPVTIRTNLPYPDREGGREIPVLLGARYRAAISKSLSPWVEQHVELGPLDSQLTFDFWQQSAVLLGDIQHPQCPPEETPCGPVEHPLVFLPCASICPPEPWVGQGERTGMCGIGGGEESCAQYLVGRLELFLDPSCDDRPESWLEAAIVNPGRHAGPCACRDDSDCAFGEECEPNAGRCIQHTCIEHQCPPGQTCDPFTSACVDPPPTPACHRDEDCGSGQVCNRYTGYCLEDRCPSLGCTPCSPYLGGCVDCLADCDCGLGVCDRTTWTCVAGCDPDKTELRSDNPESYERYTVCLQDRLADPSLLVHRFDEGLVCGPFDPPVACEAHEAACSGDLRREPDGPITADQWRALCALSRLPLVTRIVGSHD